ncbi:hypothetical protein SK224_08310 [Microbacterium sp. BG28]|uniref:hypothetical protein n=1 Tax=Microbacterium sp. BG28 TaxID=3097356 RepID=UPI002A5A7966|nr:hypothetical protein [Microbacterium sp. BG28]MDY0829127.1 hypothetical protein [Microbacterium sp. BG28]
MYKRIFPWIVFNTDNATGGGTGTPPAQETKPEIDGETFDFPLATAIDAMTPEQKAEYWRHQSKKQQRDAAEYRKLGTPADLQKLATDAETARLAALSDQERAVEAARAEARAEGAKAYLHDAVQSHIVAITKGPSESYEDAVTRVQSALAFADVNLFTSTDGTLDAAKIQQFAQSIAPVAANGQPQHGSDPLHLVLGSSTPAPQTSGGSVAQYEQAARERFAKK